AVCASRQRCSARARSGCSCPSTSIARSPWRWHDARPVCRRGNERVVGTLYVVGIGPGAADLVTPRARTALECADVIVGYTLYLELVRAWLPEGNFRPSPIGDEVQRTRDALLLAAERHRVALVGSGDAGVYGLAGLAHELRAM